MRILFALAVTAIGWASSFSFISLGLEGFSPLFLTLARYALASLAAIFIYLYLPNKVELKISQKLYASFCGMIGMGIYSFAVAEGEQSVPVSITGFIIGLMPLISSVIASFLYQEKMQRRIIAGILLSMTGLTLITLCSHGSVTFEQGILWIILALICATVYTLIQKPIIKIMPPMQFACYAFWGAAAILVLLFLFRSENIFVVFENASTVSTLSLVYLGVVPTLLSFACWSYALANTDVAKAAIALYTIPLLTAIIAFFMLKEIPSPMGIAGMTMAFFGSILGAIKKPVRQNNSVQVTISQSEA